MSRRGKTEKVSVTLPREVIEEVRAIVTQGEVSSFFTEALEHYLAYRRQKVALERGFGAWKNKNHPELAIAEDSTTYVRALREADKERLTRLENTSEN